MKYLLSFLISCTVLSLTLAQPSIRYSDVIKSGNPLSSGMGGAKFSYANHVYLSSERTATATQKPKSMLVAMNERFEIVSENLLEPTDDMPARQLKRLVETEAGGWLITHSFFNFRKGITYYAEKLHPSGVKLGEAKELLHRKIGINDKLPAFTFKISEDKSKVLLVEHLVELNTELNNRKKSDYLALKVYNASMELLWEATPSHDGEDLLLNYMDFTVNNDGVAFAVSYSDKGGMRVLTGNRKSDKLLLHKYGPDNLVKLYELPLLTPNFTDLKLDILPNGDVFIAGMSYEKEMPSTFYYYFDPFAEKFIKSDAVTHKLTPLSRLPPRFDGPLAGITVKKIFVVDEKSQYVLGEASYQNANGLLVLSDMLVVHFSSGILDNVVYIPKQSYPLPTSYSDKGFFTALHKGNLHVMFQDNYKNMEKGRQTYTPIAKKHDLIWCEIRPDGSMRHGVLAEEAEIEPNYLLFEEEHEGKIWIQGSKFTKLQLGIMTLP